MTDSIQQANKLNCLTIHVPNVWQTAEWYRLVFGFPAIFSADATAARLDVPDQRLVFAAHDAQTDTFGSRRLNSFLTDPAAFHLDIATADVQQLFDHALTHGAVPVLDPTPDAHGRLVASLRDLNGVLIQLSQLLPLPQETSN